MVKKKLFAQGPERKKKNAPRPPETADEFLVAGVEEEEGGEKWRAGDSQKSARFFARALGHYTTGLQKYPNSFDLAYNRARLRYEICQQPRILSAFMSSTGAQNKDLLLEALSDHEYALKLKDDDPDLMFNLAQLYRDMGESEYENEGPGESRALRFYQKALETFIICFNIQNDALRQSQDEAAKFAADAEELPHAQAEAVSTEEQAQDAEEQWATVVEPVTLSSIYETIVAAVQSATAMIPLALEAGKPFDELHATGTTLGIRLLSIVDEAGVDEHFSSDHPILERKLLSANLDAAFQDAKCRSGTLSPMEYSANIATAYDQEQSAPQWLADAAEADLAFNSAATLLIQIGQSDSDVVTLASLRWKHLTRALNSFTSLSKLSSEVSTGLKLAESAIHARRADCELLRRRLGEFQNGELHRESRELLAANAEKFFRGAKLIEERDGGDSEDYQAREIICAYLATQRMDTEAASKIAVKVQEALVDMVEEDLLEKSEADAILAL